MFILLLSTNKMAMGNTTKYRNFSIAIWQRAVLWRAESMAWSQRAKVIENDKHRVEYIRARNVANAIPT